METTVDAVIIYERKEDCILQLFCSLSRKNVSKLFPHLLLLVIFFDTISLQRPNGKEHLFSSNLECLCLDQKKSFCLLR